MSEMTRTMVIGKIHRARVTGADLHYVGSITIDEDLLDAANIVPGQKVDIGGCEQRITPIDVHDRWSARKWRHSAQWSCSASGEPG